MSKMIGVEHNGIVRIISLPVSGTDKQISQDEEIIISMNEEIKKLKAQNEIMRVALKEAYSYLENSEHCKYADKAYYIIDNAIETLKKVGDE